MRETCGRVKRLKGHSAREFPRIHVFLKTSNYMRCECKYCNLFLPPNPFFDGRSGQTKYAPYAGAPVRNPEYASCFSINIRVKKLFLKPIYWCNYSYPTLVSMASFVLSRRHTPLVMGHIP